jgi:hypothetical protein
MVSAQVMLPAYQGVFNRKISSTGVTSNGLDFDGVDDYVTVPSGVYFNGDFTIEAWVYPKSYSNWGRIIDFGNGPGNNIVFLAFSTGTSGYPNFRIENSQFQSSVQLPLNKWSHVSATLSGTSAVIYVDGVNAGSANLVAPPNVTRTNNLIGFSNWTADDKSNVILDDLRIWNVARTQAQIQANMNTELLGTETGLKAYYTFNQGIPAGNNIAINTVIDKSANATNGTLTNFAKNGTTSNFVLGKVENAIITNGLVLNLDAGNTTSYSGSGTIWKDISGLGNNGTLINNPTFNSSNGGNFVFNGSNTYVSVPLTKSASCTFSVWAKSSTPHSNNMLFNAGNDGSGPDLFFSGNVLSWNVWDSSGNPFGNIPATTTNGIWHHYVVVNDQASNTAKFYYDGVLYGTAAYRNASTTTSLYIGGNTITYMWNGAIATFYVYNRSLIATEVLQNFNAQKGRFGL